MFVRPVTTTSVRLIDVISPWMAAPPRRDTVSSARVQSAVHRVAQGRAWKMRNRAIARRRLFFPRATTSSSLDMVRKRLLLFGYWSLPRRGSFGRHTVRLLRTVGGAGGRRTPGRPRCGRSGRANRRRRQIDVVLCREGRQRLSVRLLSPETPPHPSRRRARKAQEPQHEPKRRGTRCRGSACRFSSGRLRNRGRDRWRGLTFSGRNRS